MAKIKKHKSPIRSYRGLTHIQINDYFVRKDAVESITWDDFEGVLFVRTVGGWNHKVSVKDARRVLRELNFNEK